MKLSKNLSKNEFTYSRTAKRYGISNEPDERQTIVAIYLAEHLFQPIREHFNVPIYLSSGFRSKALNKLIGGARTSHHMISGDIAAIDIDQDGHSSNITNAEIFHYIKDNLPFNQLIWEFGDNSNPAWVHVSFSINPVDNERKSILKAVKRFGNRTSYIPYSE